MYAEYVTDISVGDTTELQVTIASLRDIVRKQADEIQTSKTEVSELKQQMHQSKGDKERNAQLQKQLENLNIERETEVKIS